MVNELTANGDFEITPSEQVMDIENRPGFKKLELTSAQKIQMNGLLQQLPALTATNALSNMYVVQFPEGLPHTLTALKQGGESTVIKGADGRIAGTASLYHAEAQAAVLGAFNAMSIVSCQYFLSQINNELKTISQSIDKILEFLYGEKKAELMSEVLFTRYAYQNFMSIMAHESQRVATIASLQEAKKIAMKDIEFYMNELTSALGGKNSTDILRQVDDMFRIKDCLELSMQLYAMSSLLEVYYSQNYDSDYIQYVEKEAMVYIGKCEKRMLSCFAGLHTLVQNCKEGMWKKLDKPALEKKIGSVIDILGGGTESEMCKSLRTALHASEQKSEYYINKDGNVYLKVS